MYIHMYVWVHPPGMMLGHSRLSFYSLGAHLEQLGKTNMHFHVYICVSVWEWLWAYMLCF